MLLSKFSIILSFWSLKTIIASAISIDSSNALDILNIYKEFSIDKTEDYDSLRLGLFYGFFTESLKLL